MNVAFVTPSVSRSAGGIFEIERDLGRALQMSTPATVDVLGLRDEHTEADRPEWKPLHPIVFDTVGPDALGYAPDLLGALHGTGADLAHLHALWMYTSLATLRWSRQTGRPHVVTINGMLDDWALNNARWKKRLAGWLYEDANLQEAACVQVNTEAEYDAVRRYGVEGPICILPNGVTLPESPAADAPPWKSTLPPNANVVLFLGRLHPKKGLRELIEGWDAWRATSGSSTWHLAVVGWDDGGHEEVLQTQIRETGVDDSVHLLGPMFGEDKAAAFAHADAFVLPSHSEGFPMAVLEAWSYGLPVVKTPACNIPEGFEAGAALRTEPHADAIAESLSRLHQMSADDRQAMGRRGRDLVERRYSWQRIAQKMYDVYRWVLGDGPQPGFVWTD
jgi:poly(glycerol-phosphate) alpha-glucosyltransferase